MPELNLLPGRTLPGSPLPASWSAWVRSGQWQGDIDTAMPMLPALANEVIGLALDPDAAPNKITAVVAKDPVLATRVIRLANSAYSAPAIEITTISEAVVRMGTRAVRNVVLAVCVMSRLKDPKIYGAHGREIIDHGIGAAYLARLVAEALDDSPDEAFLYGLLHDIGKLLILKLAHDYGRHVGAMPHEPEIAAVVEEAHAELGGQLLHQWSLPQAVQHAVVWHHHPEGTERFRRAAEIAYAANRLAHRYGFGCAAEAFEPLGDPIMAGLGIDRDLLTSIDAHAPGLFQVARQILQ